VIPIVDAAADPVVEKRATPSARMVGAFENVNPAPESRKPNGAGQPRQTGTDNENS
jgi:hypothetical protein